MQRTIQMDGIQNRAWCSLGGRGCVRGLKSSRQILQAAHSWERSRSLRESRAQRRRAVHLCNFVRDLLAGGEVLLFAEEIPECNVAPDVHTVMIVSVFARTENLSRCRWYTTPRAEFSRLPRAANSLPTVKSFTTFVPCKRRLPVHGLTDSAARLFSLLMTNG